MAQDQETEELWREMALLNANIDRLTSVAQREIKEQYAQNPHLNEMLKSLEYTVRCLSDQHAETRRLALEVLDGFYQNADISHLLATFEQMAFADPDTRIKTHAVNFVGSIAATSSRSTRKRLGAQMAAIVLSELESVGYRKAAYRALCALSRRPEIRNKGISDLVVPETMDDVDWTYVRSWT
jgi:hypothetical protein